MKKCPFCGAEVVNAVRTCPFCDKSLYLKCDAGKKDRGGWGWSRIQQLHLDLNWGWTWWSVLVMFIFWGALFTIGAKYGMNGISVFISGVGLLLIAIIAYFLIRLIILAVNTLKVKC